MKIKVIFITLFSFICISCKSQEVQTIKEIVIKSVDIRIETPFGITCDKFESFFQGDIDTISIEDQKVISVFSKIINELKVADPSKYSLPDTRVKIDVIYNDKKTIICIDHLVLSISDNMYLTSDTMLEFIEESVMNKLNK